ncbi:hypothetical protein BLA29_011453 [Euroglyphus maynei]|uniref:Uncharacterized protein n=1 Tax=Euroglyphus maynei TaxID=6958 RepID=A0A1Y3APM0_EURMA|nr:hypothetical protein BLA29_011453 [Euroglyphus maynei]
MQKGACLENIVPVLMNLIAVVFYGAII